MGVQGDDISSLSATNFSNSESLSDAAIILIAIGSMLIILCAATIIYGLRRRRYVTKGATPSSVESVRSPTDYMNSLATWDRCNSIEDMVEKKRRSVWTLDIFENLTSNGRKNETKANLHT